MTDTHKDKLAKGRVEAKAVRDYLHALQSEAPKRGRKRTADTIAARLKTIDKELPEADPVRQLHLVQERRNLEVELASMGKKVDTTALENAFVKVAKSYGAGKGITYAAWREVGVPASALSRAGITRGG